MITMLGCRIKRIVARHLFRFLQRRHHAAEATPEPLDAT